MGTGTWVIAAVIPKYLSQRLVPATSCFMIGLVHFTHESDLLACSTGTYGCARDIMADDFYRNLTLTTLLDIDYDEYNWVGGTHEVKSIQKVNGKIQIEGSFTSNFELKGDSQFISGSYRMTIP